MTPSDGEEPARVGSTIGRGHRDGPPGEVVAPGPYLVPL
jgi:hypothetical protein